MKKKSCILIGSSGYIGRHLLHYLKQLGIEPMCYDINPSFNSSLNYLQVDLTKKSDLEKINLDVDFVFMFSGITGTYFGFDNYESYIDINEIGLLNLLDTIRKSIYRPRIIFPSTRLIYKGSEIALNEDDEKETKTIYAVNKLACEGFLNAYNKSYDIPFSIFRICVPYGNLLNNDYSFGTIGFFINQATKGKIIKLFGGGVIRRTFTNMEDLCFQIVIGGMSDNTMNGIFNVGGETLSLYEAASIIAKKYCTKVIITPWPEIDFRIETGSTFFNSDKLQSKIGEIEFKSLETFSNIL